MDSAYVQFQRRANSDVIGRRYNPAQEPTSRRVHVGSDAFWAEGIRKEQGSPRRREARDHHPDGGSPPAAPGREVSCGHSRNDVRSALERLAPGWSAAENLQALQEIARLAARGNDSRRNLTAGGAVAKINAMFTARGAGAGEIQAACCACLSNLAISEEYRRLIYRSGSVGPLVAATRSHSVAARREAAGALWNLSHRSVEVARGVEGAKGITSLVRLLSAEDVRTYRNAAGVLAVSGLWLASSGLRARNVNGCCRVFARTSRWSTRTAGS